MSDPKGALRQELMAAAERGLANPRQRSRRNRVLLIAAALTIAAALALVVTAPWASSPGFLERAEAALTPPAGSITHYRWEHETSASSGCARHSIEVWIDQTPPHTYRALIVDCVGAASEIGGVVRTKEILEFVPPNKLVVPDLIFAVPVDPVAELRAAIRSGSVHDEGATQLDGRTVRRIRIDCAPRAPCAGRPTYLYVDVETYAPVQHVVPAGFKSWTGARFDVVTRYTTFEYLPRTAANVALTDIRAQHPEASR